MLENIRIQKYIVARGVRMLKNVDIKRPNYPTVGQTKIETSLNASKTSIERLKQRIVR